MMTQHRALGGIERVRPNDPRLDVPSLGYRNYWYPVLSSRSLRSKPVRLRILGDDIVVVRAKSTACTFHALCPHRGGPLDMGVCLADSTFTCRYHGFTFDTASGKCVAALTEGPQSPTPEHLSARVYPTAERHGFVWVYMGAGTPPPIEEDIPENLAAPDTVVVCRWSVWDVSWRLAAENGIDTAHPFFLHRNHPLVRLGTVPGFAKCRPQRNGKWLQAVVEKAGMHGEYARIGRWPPPSDAWLRRSKASGTFTQEVCLPGVNRIVWPLTGMVHMRWSIPIDEKRTLILQALMKQATGLAATRFKLYYHLFEKWRYHVWFQLDDERILHDIDPLVAEHLTESDTVVVAWRRMAREARQAQRDPEGGAAE